MTDKTLRSPPHWQWVWDAMIAAATSQGEGEG